jgi:transcriptional regulator with XRE-family HTH domain
MFMAARVALRNRREELDLSQEQVALAVGVSTTAYRGWENGTSNLRVGRRRRLASVLQWSTAQLAQALEADQPVNGNGINGHAVPSWLGHLASLEQGAGHLWAFEVTTVHGLMQTAAYAYAVEQSDILSETDEGIARRVETRMARQAVLTRRPDPLVLSVILDESVLHRTAGDSSVMAVQLDRLLEVAGYPNVELQILPLTAGAFVFGSFTLFASPAADTPFMAITEDRAGPHYLDRPSDVAAHIELFNHLSSVSLDPAESLDVIAAAKEKLP